jgi:hypothetical protein
VTVAVAASVPGLSSERKQWKNGPVAPSPKYHWVASWFDPAEADPPPSVPPSFTYIARSAKIGTSEVMTDPTQATASAGPSWFTGIVVRLCGGSVCVVVTCGPASIR